MAICTISEVAILVLAQAPHADTCNNAGARIQYSLKYFNEITGV
jgi:hypothetical protein